jgi:hypothetical protein
MRESLVVAEQKRARAKLSLAGILSRFQELRKQVLQP